MARFHRNSNGDVFLYLDEGEEPLTDCEYRLGYNWGGESLIWQFLTHIFRRIRGR